jgi:hypothetical protein
MSTGSFFLTKVTIFTGEKEIDKNKREQEKINEVNKK